MSDELLPPIRIYCPACSRVRRVPSEAAGRKVRCNQCGQTVKIAPPRMESEQPKSDDELGAAGPEPSGDEDDAAAAPADTE